VEAVRGVDRHGSQGQVDEFRLVELRPRQLIDFIRHTAFGDASHGLTPGQRGALTIAVEGRLLPGVEEMKPLLAKLPRVRSSWATRRVSSIAIMVRLEAVETRLTPSRSSVAMSGVPARPTMLMGLDYPGQSRVSVGDGKGESVGDGKGEDAIGPAAK
jgi:hypothetical protein